MNNRECPKINGDRRNQIVRKVKTINYSLGRVYVKW